MLRADCRIYAAHKAWNTRGGNEPRSHSSRGLVFSKRTYTSGAVLPLERPFVFSLFRPVQLFAELINANCMPFYFRLLDTPYSRFSIHLLPPSLSLSFSVCDGVRAHTHTHIDTSVEHTRISLSSSIHSLPLRLPLSVSHLSPLIPLSHYSLSSLPAWLLAADWVVEVCHSGYRPADTPNPLSLSHIRSLHLSPSLSRSLFPSSLSASALRRSSLQSPNNPFARRSCSLCI